MADSLGKPEQTSAFVARQKNTLLGARALAGVALGTSVRRSAVSEVMPIVYSINHAMVFQQG